MSMSGLVFHGRAWMPPPGEVSDASMSGRARSTSRAAVAARSSRRTTPPARTSRATSAEDTFEHTSGVARATMAARSTSSDERPAGSGCTRTCTSGWIAFQRSVTRCATASSVGFAGGQ